MKNAFLSLSLFCFAITSSMAQSPGLMNYQGVARDNAGNVLANQNIGLQFTIRSGSPNGTVTYQERQFPTTSGFGLFNVLVGNGNVLQGNFNAIDWGSNTHFLQVEMDAVGGTDFAEMGTSQLVSVPYALYAETSGDAGVPGPEGPQGPQGDPATDDQTLTVNGNQLTISGGNTVTLPNDADADLSNELQTLSISNDTIFLSNGNYVVLPPGQGMQSHAEPFFLDGERADETALRVLNWTSVIDSGNYQVYRNDSLLETVDASITTWTDDDLDISGNLSYMVLAKMLKEASLATTIESNILEFSNTVELYYGDGRDGVFTGGTIDRSRNYYFTEIDMASGSVMDFINEGNGTIKVAGDMVIASGATIELRTDVNQTPGMVQFGGITRDLNVQPLNYGVAGNGGTFTSEALVSPGGNGGAVDSGEPGQANGYYGPDLMGIPGAAGTYPNGNGENGQTEIAGGTLYGAGGGGGAAGQHGASCESLAFFVGGNAIISGTINGAGTNGQDGGNGGDGTGGSYPSFHGGNGGGGAGGAGGHGGNVYIYVLGASQSSFATLVLDGGVGGTGGAKGTFAGTLGNETDGGPGGNGNDGILEIIPVTVQN